MTIEICTVGGFDEVGKNMTAVKVEDEVIILDMGLHLDSYIHYTEDEDNVDFSPFALTKIGAVPDISIIKDWIKHVKVIIPTHAHLDHVGAIPYISNKFRAPILCTSYTAEIIRRICSDQKISLKNEIKTLNANSTFKISNQLSIEFVYMTHSVPQTVMVILHTPHGKIVYGNDFKFDDRPVIGKKPNYTALKKIGASNDVLCLVIDSTKCNLAQKTPSEQVAHDMLKDVMLGTESEGKAVIVTTFSSHLARLKSIIEFGKKLNRKIIFLGRSLSKYVDAGESIGIINFSKDVELVSFKKKIAKRLKEISKSPEKYLIVCTGHQGEPKAVLSRMANGEFEFRFGREDHVIFSCTIIPSELNRANRERLEGCLRKRGVRIFRDIHASGHASKEDLRDLINMLKPKHVIPAHGDDEIKKSLVDLCAEMGFNQNQIHVLHNGDFIKF